ncbi:pirin family protein, partial [Candidatus Woesearchaeota archaeon]|nr:pirin family protein [Candidatus Woesearchaeota archaeon]
RGTFIMIIEGSSQIENEKLSKRDSIEITDTNKITIKANKNSKLLLIDVPM